MEPYNVWLLVIGLACMGAAWLPHLLHQKPLSFPMVYIGVGVSLFSLPLGIDAPDPLQFEYEAERLTELIVIIALLGGGLKLDRPPGWRRWAATWRLLGFTMVLSIAAFAWAGWALLGLDPASALLLGAVLAPTDPVLASQVQAGPPNDEADTEVRITLTAEAGLNDGLAFPFTHLALAVAAAGLAPEFWLADWLLDDLLYRVALGVLVGAVVGYGTGYLIYGFPVEKRLAETEEGIVALGLTLLAYAATELVDAYGFLAVFVSGLSLRQYERTHDYHRTLHKFTEDLERLLMAVLLILFGGALAGGLLRHLTWEAALVGVAFVLLVRPAAGLVGLAGLKRPFGEKAAMAFFGIRGMGSFYYLAYALHRAVFEAEAFLWAVVSFVVLVSVIVHGVLAFPVMRRLERPA
jgi:NhaP-type Na+/H+ or K+/H+ antiporter